MFIVNRQSKRYVRGYCGSAILCPKFLEEVLNPTKEKIEQIIKYIAPTIISKLLSEVLSREIVFDEPVNTDIVPFNTDIAPFSIARGSKTTTQYDTYKTTILDQEINLFLTKDLESDSSGTDEFTIAIVAGGGTGGKSDHNAFSESDLNLSSPSNGGGGGGGIFQAYNIRGKKGDLITLHIGSGGKMINDSLNGESGKKSYVRYYKSGEASYWLYDSKSGENGDRERRGECFRGVLGGSINGDYYEGMGGNGGDERNGQTSYFFQSGEPFTFKSTGVVWPSNFDSSASGGGGGSAGTAPDVFDAGAPGGYYYVLDDANNNGDIPKYILTKGDIGSGGQRGNELVNYEDSEAYKGTMRVNYLNGNNATNPGAGGGSGGAQYKDIGGVTSDVNDYSVDNGSGSDGGNGIGMLFRCLASDGQTSFDTTFSGKTSRYAYVIVPYQYDSTQSTGQFTHTINLNLTTSKTVKYILIGGGGAGGKSSDGSACGGGGSGGLVYGSLNLVAGDKINVSVGKGGIHNKSDNVGTNGGHTSLWLNGDGRYYVMGWGGDAGTDNNYGYGAGTEVNTNSKFIDTTRKIGGNGGLTSNGQSGATVPASFIDDEIETACKPFVMTKYAGGGGSGKGNHDGDYDYSGGGGGKMDGSGGLGGAHDGAAGEGFPAESFGGGGGGGGYSKAGHNYIGGNGASGICALWYLM